jgi:ATP-dependent RNA helicase DDX27
VTLVGEADRKFLKAVIKHAADQGRVRHRLLPTDVMQRWSEKLVDLKDEISAILLEEKEQKHVSFVSFEQ